MSGTKTRDITILGFKMQAPNHLRPPGKFEFRKFALSKIAKTYFLLTMLMTPPVSPLWGSPTPDPRGECFAPHLFRVALLA